MNNYIGLLFLVPSVLGFFTFFSWALVWSRMTNLGVSPLWRVFICVWSMGLLGMSVFDISWEHQYLSNDHAFFVVATKTFIRVGTIGLAVYVYRLLGQRYPIRMACSEYEPNVHY